MRFALVSTALLLSTLTVQAAVAPRECVRTMTPQSALTTATLMNMRSIRIAIEAYAIDHKAYPTTASLPELEKLVSPNYIRTISTKDAWGTELRYLPTPDGKAYRIVSAGADRTFDEASWGTPGLLTTPQEDAVLGSDGNDREWIIQR